MSTGVSLHAVTKVHKYVLCFGPYTQDLKFARQTIN